MGDYTDTDIGIGIDICFYIYILDLDLDPRWPHSHVRELGPSCCLGHHGTWPLTPCNVLSFSSLRQTSSHGGNYTTRKSGQKLLGWPLNPQPTQRHFHHIPVVKASHKASPDSRGGKIGSMP